MRFILSKYSMIFFYLLATLFCPFFSSYSTAQEAIIMAYGHNYRPFSWEENEKMMGLQIDIVREIFEKRMGIPVINQGYPWKRAQMLVAQGIADGLFTVDTPDRQKYAQAGEETLITINNTLYTYKNHKSIDKIKKIDSFEGLKNYRIVDYIGGSWSKDKLKESNIYRVSEIGSALEFLSKKRADIFIQSARITDYNIKKLGLSDKIIKTDVIFSTEHHQLLIRKDSKFSAILPRVDEVVREMKRDGTMQAIFHKYQ